MALLGSLGIKLALMGVAVAAFLGLAVATQHYYRQSIVLNDQVQAKAAENDTLRAQATQIATAFQAYQDRTAARLADTRTIRSAVHAAPVTSSCARSPAVAAVLVGMRDRQNHGFGSAAGTGGTAVLPAGAAAASH